MKKIFLLGCFLFLTWLAVAFSPWSYFLTVDDPLTAIGEAQVGKPTKAGFAAHCHEILMASFNSLDVDGNQPQIGKRHSRKRKVTPMNFRRIPVRSADVCISCHYLPFASRGGETGYQRH